MKQPKQQLTDLEKFKKAFDRESRPFKDGLEYRVKDIDYDLPAAKLIIQKMGLDLIAGCIGNSASMRTFFVTPSSSFIQ